LKNAQDFVNFNKKPRRMAMGLWMKCPGCQVKNPLYFKVCSQCGQSLDDLPPEKRVYVVEEAAALAAEVVKAGPPAAVAAAPPPPPAPAMAEAQSLNPSRWPRQVRKPKRSLGIPRRRRDDPQTYLRGFW
jgi:hypothetical protein